MALLLTITNVNTRLSTRVGKFLLMNERLAMIECIELGAVSESKRSHKDMSTQNKWVESEIDNALANSKMATAKDGNSLLAIARRLSPQDIFKRYDDPFIPFLYAKG
jgi:hypothetical protein